MSYEKTTWATGDVVTAEKLNNIEDGIANARRGFKTIELLPSGNDDGYYVVRSGLSMDDNFFQLDFAYFIRFIEEYEDSEYYEEALFIAYPNTEEELAANFSATTVGPGSVEVMQKIVVFTKTENGLVAELSSDTVYIELPEEGR